MKRDLPWSGSPILIAVLATCSPGLGQPGDFAVHTFDRQRLTAGRQEMDAGAHAHQRVDQLRGGVDDVLAVVHHDQHAAVAQHALQRQRRLDQRDVGDPREGGADRVGVSAPREAPWGGGA